MSTVYVLQEFPETADGLIPLLPPWRAEKVRALHKEGDKVHCALGYLLLKKAAKEEYGICSLPPFSFGQWGKPYFENACLEFNLSHCKSAVACAVSAQPVGVDVQDKIAYQQALAKRLCTGKALEELEHCADQNTALTALWTQKEALGKQSGKGLCTPCHDLQGDCRTYVYDSFCLSVCPSDAEIRFVFLEEVLK